MKNTDLKIILNLSSAYPELLSHFLSIYKLGHKQGTIDELTKLLETQ